jgi:hypothetical protein
MVMSWSYENDSEQAGPYVFLELPLYPAESPPCAVRVPKELLAQGYLLAGR